VTEQPITDAQRALLEHRWAVRVNLPSDVMHAARTARRAVDVAAYARLDAPEVVTRAVEVLEGWAIAVDQRVKTERAQRVLFGMDDAGFQRQLERGGEQEPR
jgi:hypothetical protein